MFALPVAAQTRYVITNLGNLGGTSTQANAINASGAIVGFDATSFQVAKPFIFSGTAITALPTLNLQRNEANGINASGVVVGTNTGFPSAETRGFIVSNGVVTDLGANTSAVGIADDGTVAGNAFPRAFVRSSTGTVTPFGPSTTIATAMSRNGIVAGYTETANRRAFRYAGGTLTDLGALPGGSNSYGYGVNNAGTVVGSSNESTNRFLHAVIYSGGTVTDIDPTGTGALGSAALGINSAGTVVGQNSVGRAFIYTAATGIVDLNTLVTNLAASGFASLTSATAINDAGQIVGYGTVGGRTAAFRLDVSVAPAITAHPQPQTVPPGSSVVFSVTATGAALQYEWRLNNAPIAGATASTYTIPSATAGQAGSYTVRVSSGGESVTSNPASLAVTPGTTGRLINLSILTSLAGAADSFTMGYVVGGTGTSGSKPLVIRAAGPSLSLLGVTDALSDPKIELFAGATKTLENDNWGGGAAVADAMAAVGAFAFTGAASRDSALAVSTTQRDNSVKVSPVGNLTGSVLAEVYDATPAASVNPATPRLINVSVIKHIGTSLSAGFVIGGTASRTVLIRAVGPTLGTAFGLSGVVADPQLVLFNAAAAKIGENDNWGGGTALAAAFTSVGAFELPAASRDAALLVTLAPGNYSVQVSGVGNTTGTALVEVYEVP
ncbi:MAG: hypothetical protein JNK23_16615 [Opitutaceae bacterium]|nr:hypothetical protein [Opitutaceae bacterium]